jgi:hypothetical protein
LAPVSSSTRTPARGAASCPSSFADDRRRGRRAGLGRSPRESDTAS